MKESLDLRVKILEENGIISKKVADYTTWVADELLKTLPRLSQDKAEMFITHLAMAGKRAEEGTAENPIDEMVLEAVKEEEAYAQALEMRDRFLAQTDIAFPQTEKDFLSVHLCNLIS